MQSISCQVGEISQLSDHIYKIILTPETPVEFNAGQYLLLVLGEKDKRAFSIACAPGSEQLEVHIGAGAADGYAMGAVEHLKANETVTIEAPGGDAYLREYSERPVLLVAGGTGFTYTKSIADQLLKQKLTRPVVMYWGVRAEASLYDCQHWQQKAAEDSLFSFVPVVENADDAWSGKSGKLIDAVLQDFAALDAYDVYCAGRFEMVGAARDAFKEKGLVVERMFGDAFAYIK